jgi:hemoglobin
MRDGQLGRFWQNRSSDGIARERQLLIDYLSSASGGPMYYTGRDMKLSHECMGISESDWSIFTSHVADAPDHLSVGDPERGDVLGFIESLMGDIVEVPERKW